ncbi:M23 family metallopeptidase [Metabacillus halosaccharovorans]|uniref:M23 family metallopeptidase n=1 Tax=Metabacillus halosaccharovorans TaxID=930124 RepID=UPI00111785F6|nr:M23 family metallopeptidase [Metabacillus halosaccharovorans]
MQSRQNLFVCTICIFIGLFLVVTNSARAESHIKELEDTWIQPVQGTITDTFGTRNGKHKGIDIAAPEGAQIISVSSGLVVKSYYSDTYGHVVFIKHPEGYETVYAHLRERNVQQGEKVTKGQILGIIGNTGVSTGTHLHFEVHKGEWTFEKEHAVDPLFVFEEDVKQTVYAEDSAIDSVETNAQGGLSETTTDKQEENSQKNVITVVKGDTLWRLSNTFNVSVSSIKKWNNLKNDVIFPNQELTIFIKNSANYVVQPGDTIQSIAAEFSTSPEAIKKINDITSEKIYPEQVLVINK